MPFDGLFLHNLINELKEKIENKKIYKIISITDTDYVFTLKDKINLLVSINPSHAHIRLTNKDYMHSNTYLYSYLHKHIEGGIIESIKQIDNDRIVCINIISNDELGYQKYYRLYLELMGKFSNLIITDNDDIILEAYKKSYLTDNHLIKVGIKYLPLKDDKINPFQLDNYDNINYDNIQGLSKQVINEMNHTSIKDVLRKPINPTLIKGNKNYFYHIDLTYLEGERKHYNSLSELLEYYYDDLNKITNDTYDLIKTKTYLEKEIEKIKNKINKQKNELEDAKKYNETMKLASLLLSNIHLIKYGMDAITIFDYETNSNITISLSPTSSPKTNINNYFNKAKKMKRSIDIINNTINNSLEELKYYEDNLEYLNYSKSGDLKEIMIELGMKKAPTKNMKPHISKYIDDDGNIYYFGKNNVQNNYLSHCIAKANDYFFHVKNISGSHVILSGELNDKTIFNAANIAAYYSKARDNIHVCVDYTQVKWIKKVKGTKGSFVTYTHEKMAFSDPDINYINKTLKLIN